MRGYREATSACFDCRDLGLHRKENAGKIDRPNLVPNIFAEIVKRAMSLLYASIMNGEIYPF